MQIASRQCVWKSAVGVTGTVLAIEASEASRTVKITGGTLAEGSDSVTVDWGDGVKSEYASLSGVAHTYQGDGEFHVRISDDLKMFNFAGGLTLTEKDMLRELVSLGSKVTELASFSFNNCHRLRGVMNLPNVTKIGSYAFGTALGFTDYILPSMTKLQVTSFYSGSTPTQMHADNVKEIEAKFWDFYGGHLADVYLRNSTCEEIKKMANFPFYAEKKNPDARFHGSDGIVLVDGTVIPN